MHKKIFQRIILVSLLIFLGNVSVKTHTVYAGSCVVSNSTCSTPPAITFGYGNNNGHAIDGLGCAGNTLNIHCGGIGPACGSIALNNVTCSGSNPPGRGIDGLAASGNQITMHCAGDHNPTCAALTFSSAISPVFSGYASSGSAGVDGIGASGGSCLDLHLYWQASSTVHFCATPPTTTCSCPSGGTLSGSTCVVTCSDITDAQAQCYLNRYSDLAGYYGSTNIAGAKSHWYAYGYQEGRDKSCPIDNGCAANTCTTATCNNSITTVQGTKACDNGCAANTCTTATCNNSITTVQGTKACDNGCAALTCTTTQCWNNLAWVTGTQICADNSCAAATCSKDVCWNNLVWIPGTKSPTYSCAESDAHINAFCANASNCGLSVTTNSADLSCTALHTCSPGNNVTELVDISVCIANSIPCPSTPKTITCPGCALKIKQGGFKEVAP